MTLKPIKANCQQIVSIWIEVNKASRFRSGARSSPPLSSRRSADAAIRSSPRNLSIKGVLLARNARATGGQFVLHTKALPGNSYDGHTLRDQTQAQARSAIEPVIGRPTDTAVTSRAAKAMRPTSS